MTSRAANGSEYVLAYVWAATADGRFEQAWSTREDIIASATDGTLVYVITRNGSAIEGEPPAEDSRTHVWRFDPATREMSLDPPSAGSDLPEPAFPIPIPPLPSEADPFPLEGPGTTYNSARAAHANGVIYVAGGCCQVNTLYAYDLDAHTWRDLGEVPTEGDGPQTLSLVATPRAVHLARTWEGAVRGMTYTYDLETEQWGPTVPLAGGVVVDARGLWVLRPWCWALHADGRTQEWRAYDRDWRPDSVPSAFLTEVSSLGDVHHGYITSGTEGTLGRWTPPTNEAIAAALPCDLA